MSQLREEVARAIAVVYANRSWEATAGERAAEAAAAATSVVLDEAKRAVEALKWHIAGEGPPWEDDPLLIDRSEALAALAALGDHEVEP